MPSRTPDDPLLRLAITFAVDVERLVEGRIRQKLAEDLRHVLFAPDVVLTRAQPRVPAPAPTPKATAKKAAKPAISFGSSE